MTKKIWQEITAIILVVIGIFISSQALFHEGFFRTIDDITPVRIEYLSKEILARNKENFPIRMSAHLGYNHGYPLYLFYSPLSYYVGGMLIAWGNLSNIVATKALYSIPLIIGPLIFYLAARIRLSIWASVLATLAFSIFPFRGWDIYVRGGVAEMWAMMMIPLILIGSSWIESKRSYGIILAGLGLGLTILSHNITGMIICGLLILYAVLNYRFFTQYILSILLGLGLSAFFWLPSLYYLDLVKVGYSAQNTGLVLSTLYPLNDLLLYLKTYEYTRPFSAHVIIPVIFGLVIVSLTKHRSKKVIQATWWSIITIFSYLLMSNSAKMLWELTLPFSRLIQFAWRLMVILSVVIPLSYGVIFDALKSTFWRSLYAITIILIFVQFLVAFRPQEYSYYYNYLAEETGACAVSWGEEYLPIWVEKCLESSSESPINIISGNAMLNNLVENNLLISADILVSESSEILVNKYYFPGWNVYVNSSKIESKHPSDKYGRFSVILDEGDHHLVIKYEKTPIMQFADLTTLASLAIVLFNSIKLYKKT